MFGGRSFDVEGRRPFAAEDLVDGWLARAREDTARLGELTATARSSGGRVSVTVGPAGTITGLDLAESIRDQPAADTAREILAAVRAAQASLTTEADRIATASHRPA
jgi:DNA-binding protein YbaB